MKIDFLLVGLPRSGTTWAANWLNTGDTYCEHDPLYTAHYSEWGTSIAGKAYAHGYKLAGAACTGIWRWPVWVNRLNIPTIVVVRDVDEVNAGLEAIGLPTLDQNAPKLLDKINAPKVNFMDLFDPECACTIWEHLFDGKDPAFSSMRHRELLKYVVQPNHMNIDIDREVTLRLYSELESAMWRQHSENKSDEA